MVYILFSGIKRQKSKLVSLIISTKFLVTISTKNITNNTNNTTTNTIKLKLYKVCTRQFTCVPR